jgi:hypothetical protein
MSPKDKVNASTQPDCPREYQDDYIGRSPSKPPRLILLAVAVVLLGVCAVVYALSQGGG